MYNYILQINLFGEMIKRDEEVYSRLGRNISEISKISVRKVNLSAGGYVITLLLK